MAAACRLNVSPRLLYLLDNFPGPAAGGTESQFWLLYGAIDKTAWRPRVVTLRPSPYLESRLGNQDYASLDVTTVRSVRALWRLVTFAFRARRQGFRVAHLYLNDVSVVMPPLLWLAGIRVIVSRRDLGFWYTPGLLRILRFNRRFVDRVVANCAAVRDAVCSAEGYLPSEVDVVLNGVSRPPTHLRATGFRAAAGVPEDALVLGMIANLRPLKRVDDAIRALALTPTGGASVWLLVAGEDRLADGRSLKQTLTELAIGLGVADRVVFVGAVSDSWGFLREVDVVLSCSDTEGLSNSIIEAMATGRPVVGSAVGGTPELIEDGTTGYLYPARDVSALARHIEHLMTDPALRDRMGRAAARLADATMSERALRERHEALYRRLAAVPDEFRTNVEEHSPR